MCAACGKQGIPGCSSYLLMGFEQGHDEQDSTCPNQPLLEPQNQTGNNHEAEGLGQAQQQGDQAGNGPT